MCGIFGIVNLSSSTEIDEVRSRAALDTIRHRGPDAQNIQRLGERALFGHVRLSIIDLTTDSNQPFCFGGRYWIVFNGEIFNYVELRRELEALGASFRTRGDTEVLVQAYVQWGERCVERFNGMWAFAILDMQTGKVFCSRDRFGEKPFNYAICGDQLLFSSEIKALLAYQPSLRRPNLCSIANYCRTSLGAQHSETWFEGVLRLPPGHNLIVDGRSVRKERYWHYPTQAETKLDFVQAQERYRELFDDAVRVRLRSDVPYGLTLSSGIDSASIACTMQRLERAPHCAYTVAFNTSDFLASELAPYGSPQFRIDETSLVKRLVGDIGLQSNFLMPDYSDFVSSISKTLWHLESGNSSPAVIPLMQLLARARQDVKVVLEGQGADELLGGYVLSVIWPAVLGSASRWQLLEAVRSIHGFSQGHSITYATMIALRNLSNILPLISAFYQRYSGIDAVFGAPLRNQAHLKDYPDLAGEGRKDLLSKVLLHQHSGGLVNLLHYGDAISMANSIESRNPFMDYRLVEFALALPSDYIIRRGIGKSIHREAMLGRVPTYILNCKEKIGFTTPIGRILTLRGGGGALPAPVDALLSDHCLARGMFERDGMANIIAAHREGRHDHGNLLYRLLSTEIWFRVFIDSSTAAVAT